MLEIYFSLIYYMFSHCILKTTLAKPRKRQHKILIETFFLTHHFLYLFVASKFNSNQITLQLPMLTYKIS